ncbi:MULTISPECIES: enoyl-CoA hydratase [Bacillaceae]|uniref:enoyl-CoA hydratase/isomerase family protein n=1 Tax=Bacillaceae TaxID=186817 RepID=UPI001BDE88EF|nr:MULTISPECIES: enoyl-CoA hydratase [Bacillaceae]MDX8360218.1 enoyl-CoA hydratase [Cytobacillus sp. IB215316]
MQNEHLIVNIEGPIMVLTLNRPESLNPFSSHMILGLSEAMEIARDNDDIRAVVIRGAGRAFSAGGDVKSMGVASSQQIYDHIGKLNECIKLMKDLPKPIIAAVHGFAAGAGFNLALACDLIIAADNSKFVFSFSQVGLISDGGGSYFFPRLVGPYRAKELFFSGETVSADQAKELGILNRVVPLESLESETTKLAMKLAHGPSKAYGMMKKIIDRSYESSLDDILEQERITQTLMIHTEDHLEGVSAFKEKRKPQFKGK